MPTMTPDTSVAGLSELEGEDYCNLKWEEALAACKERLPSTDFEKLKQFKTCDALLESLRNKQRLYNSKGLPLLLRRTSRFLGHLQSFTALITLGARVKFFQTAIVWGVVSLVMEAALACQSRLPAVVDMLDDTSHALQIFRLYEWVFKIDSEMEDALVDVLVEIIIFWAQVIRFLRRHPLENLARAAWPSVQEDFEASLRRVDKHVQRVKEKAQVTSVSGKFLENDQAVLVRELERLRTAGQTTSEMDPEEEGVALPCNNIPFPKNPYFFGRQAELNLVRETLDHNAEVPKFESLVLCGMGGIGKTQIALAYVHERVSKGIPAVFWVNSETAIDMAQSFTQIATSLNLKGAAAEGGHELNRYLVMKWLQKTHCKWLLVFDNADDPQYVRGCWPIAPQGSVLITSRNDMLSIEPGAGSLDIPTFNNEEASEFLLNTVRRSNYSSDELESAQHLGQDLGGLALALNMMATQIRLKKMRIQQFLITYHKNVDRLHGMLPGGSSNIHYKHSLTTAWQTAFESLDEFSAAIFEVLCFVSPDDIPETLFVLENSELLPTSLNFCVDEWSLEEALQTLINNALIRREPESMTFHVHRIIQQEFRKWMGPEKRFESFKTVSRLLLHAFPKQVNGRPLRKRWATCKQFILHALALTARVREYHFTPAKDSGSFDNFTELMTNCAWYLFEVGLWTDCLDLLNTALPTCEDQNSLYYASLCLSAGAVEYERAHTEVARPYIEKCRSIRSALLPEFHEEIANDCNNYANLILQESRTPEVLAEAEALYLRGLSIDKRVDEHKPLEERDELIYIKLFGLAHVYGDQGLYEKAIEYLREGQKYAIRSLGPSGYWDAWADYQIGSMHYKQEHWDLARDLFERALAIFAEENDISPTTSATQLKLARIAIKQRRYSYAIDLLRKTKVICQLNERVKGDQGDTARVLRCLSEALEGSGDHEEAKKLKIEAEEIRRKIQGHRYEELPDNEQSYNLLVYQLFW